MPAHNSNPASKPKRAKPSSDDNRNKEVKASGDRAAPGEMLFAGAIIARRFALKRLIGKGGMGVVWEVHDKTLGRDVALKFLGAEIASDLEAVTDLQRETRRSLELTHPNIVRVYDYVEDHDFQLVGISMELLTGQSLQSLKLKQDKWVFQPETVRPWLRQICAALDYAHQTVGVVHRDLKPGNIFINERGALKIVDFGVAMVVRESTSHVIQEARLSRSGTLTYMSPQQLRGDKPTPADDWYSVGALLYELFTGKPPFFRGDPHALMHQVLTNPPVGIAQRQAEMGVTDIAVPPAWEKAIMACLSKEAEGRPTSGATLLAMLEGFRPPEDRPPAPTASALPFAPVDSDKTVMQLPPLSVPLSPSSTTRSRPPHPLLSRPPVKKDANATSFSGSALAGQRRRAAPPTPRNALAAMSVIALLVVAAVVVIWSRQTPKPVAPPPAPVIAAAFTLTVDPSDANAQVQIDDRLPMIVPPDGRLVIHDLPDGAHILSAQAPGFEPFKARTVLRDHRGEFNIGLVALRGSIEVTARPNSKVIVRQTDGTEIVLGHVGASGRTVFSERIQLGEGAMRFEHPDCLPTEFRRFTVAPDQTTRIRAEQKVLPASLTVATQPAGAEIFIDGQSRGKDPAEISDLKAESEMQIEVRLDGYEVERQRYTFKPREHREFSYTLQPIKGDVMVAARPGTRVIARRADRTEVELGSIGPSGEATFAHRLTQGPWTLDLEHADCQPSAPLDIDVDRARPARVVARQLPLPGVLDLRSEPAGAEIWIQGVKQGNTPAVIESLPTETPLPLEIRLRGHLPITRTVTLRPRERSSLMFDRFTAEYVYARIDVQPWDELRGHKISFSVDGTAVAPRSTMGSIAEIRFDAGADHVLQIQAEGFRERTVNIDTSNNRLQQRVTLEALPAQVAILSSPNRALVWLNGIGPKETPTAFSDLPPGRYTLRIEKNGFQPHLQELVLGAGDNLKIGPIGLAMTPIAPAPPARSVSPSAATIATPTPVPTSPAPAIRVSRPPTISAAPPVETIPSGTQSVGLIKLSGHTRADYIVNVVRSTALARGWSIVKAEANVVVINLKNHDYDSTLYLRCQPSLVEIFSDSYRSGVLGWLKQTPTNWVQDLHADLARQLY